MEGPSRNSEALVFRNEQGIVSVAALAPEVVRVRFAPKAAFGRDHSYAVVSRDLGDPRARVETSGGRTVLETAALRVVIDNAPFRLHFAAPGGEIRDADDPDRGIDFVGRRGASWCCA